MRAACKNRERPVVVAGTVYTAFYVVKYLSQIESLDYLEAIT